MQQKVHLKCCKKRTAKKTQKNAEKRSTKNLRKTGTNWRKTDKKRRLKIYKKKLIQ